MKTRSAIKIQKMTCGKIGPKEKATAIAKCNNNNSHREFKTHE